MTQLPMLSGIKASQSAEYRQSYPINLEPVALINSISKGQLRAAAGAVPFATGPGVDRGGLVWKDELYRVMGTKVVKVSSAGVVTELGDVGGEGPVSLDQGFDRFVVRSGTNLYYCDGVTVTQVTDDDLGPVIDLISIDGYTMTTDGEFVVVTELNDPYSVKPLKYGTAEQDPDKITGLIKYGQEAHVLGEFTIQVLQNVGGNGFPFAVLKSASVPVGCVSASAKCLFADSYAFVGCARGEALGVYFAGSGTPDRISTRAIDDELALVDDPTKIVLENRTSRAERRLLVHLPTKTLVFCLTASREMAMSVWYVATSRRGDPYRLRNGVRAYGKVIVGDVESSALGVLSEDVSTHFGEPTEWQFDIFPVYNAGKSAILHQVELMGLAGRAPSGVEGRAFLSMSRDGETFSTERAVSMGKRGDRSARMQWRPHARFRQTLILRFRGYDAAMPGFASCEAEFEPLGA